MTYRKALAISSAVLLAFAVALGLLLTTVAGPKLETASVHSINALNVAQISAVAVNNRTGAYGFIVTPDGSVNLVAKPEVDQAEYSREEMQAFIFMLSKLAASQALDKYTSLAEFGLDDPQANFSLILKDGSTLRFRLGNASPLGDGYYFQKEGDPRVYLIGKLTGDLMLRARTDYWNRILLPAIDVKSVDLLHGISLASTQQAAANWRLDHLGASTFRLAEPVSASVNADKVFSQLLLACSSFAPDKFVALADDLATYGLDHPEHVLTIEFDEQSFQLLFASDGKGGFYVTKAGKPAVFLASAEKTGFLKVGYRDLLGDYLYNGSPATVDSIEFSRPATNASMRLALFGEGGQRYGIIDGVSVPYAQVTQALAPLYHIGIVGEVNDDEQTREEVMQALKQPPLATITVRKRQGTTESNTESLEFFAKDNTLSFVRIDGKTSFTAYSSAAVALETSLASLRKGGNEQEMQTHKGVRK